MGQLKLFTRMKNFPTLPPPLLLYLSYLYHPSLCHPLHHPPPTQTKDSRSLSLMGGDNAVRYGNGDYSSVVTAPPSPAINPNDTKMEAAQSSLRFRFWNWPSGKLMSTPIPPILRYIPGDIRHHLHQTDLVLDKIGRASCRERV